MESGGDEKASDPVPVLQNSIGLEPTSPPEQLSGVAVVIIIAVGVQTIIMLFIFAKRQIMRFTLRSRRGPHVSVGQGGVKTLRREIDRRLEYASHIRYSFNRKLNPIMHRLQNSCIAQGWASDARKL